MSTSDVSVRLVAVILGAACAATPATFGQAPPEPPPAAEDAPARETETATGTETAAEPTGPRMVTPEDYGQFESLGFRATVSPAGTWLAYTVRRVDETSEMRVRMLATSETRAIAEASRPAFSADGTWLAYTIGHTPDEREALRAKEQPVENRLGLLNLTTGDTIEIDGVSSFRFSDDGAFLAMRRYGAKGQSGADVVVRTLKRGLDVTFGNVTAWAWADDSALLALTVRTAGGPGSGVQLYDAETGVLRVLDSSEQSYHSLAWREDAADLAVLRTVADDDAAEAPAPRGRRGGATEEADTNHDILVWWDLDTKRPDDAQYTPAGADGFPADHVITAGSVEWSDDGAAVFVQLKERARDDEEATDAGDGNAEADADAAPDDAPKKGGTKEKTSARAELKKPSNVEVWHARDIDIVPRQQRTAGRDRNRTRLAAWRMDDATFVMLENDLTEDARLLDGQRHALGMDNTPHEEVKRFGPTLADLYVIDVATGARTRFLEANKFRSTGDPNGRYVLYLRDDQWWAYDIEHDTHRALTAGLDADFINDEGNQLTDDHRHYGVAGWEANGRAVWLNSRWDLWRVDLTTGKSRRLTNGAADHIRHRRHVIDRDAEEFIDGSRDVYLSLYGDRTKQSGYARLTGAKRRFERLVWEDAAVNGLTRAEDAEVYVYASGRFDDSPDYFVTDAEFDHAKQVTETNPFLAEFHWGRGELVNYTSENGEALQAALLYPADYDESRSYPMIVSIYENRSQELHRFSTPSEYHPYNHAVYTQEGYFVLLPDITYRAQNPGVSSVECVVPAVHAAIEQASIDKERVGLVGHSWGAYQTAFIVTQSDVFAAGIAGAPLTNMMSMSMSIYWNSGQSDAWIFHESQGRMDRPFWQDVDTYIANSPIFSIDDMDTPLLVAFGDDDGAVDFNQGVEMYNAARLAGKQFVMLVYPGENHGLARKENQVDYHHRILEWFGHYLKGDDAKPWITDGVPWLEQEDARKKK